MRNSYESKSSFLGFLEEQLARRLPPDWAFGLKEQPLPTGGPRPGATFLLSSPDGRLGEVAIEFKTMIEPRMVAQIKSQVAHGNFETILVGAPFLSPRTRELLAEAELSYADLTGNLRLVAREPAVYIEAAGAQKSPWREPKPLKSLKGRAVARVLRALCDFSPPYGVGDLAKRSGASLPTASRVVSFLEREALLTRKGRGVVSDVSWNDLIRRWVQDYSVLEANAVSSFLEPRGLADLKNKLSTTTAQYAVTGSLAAQIPTSVAPPRLAMIYVQNPVALAKLLDLRPAETGGNVFLLEPFDPVVFDRTSVREGLTCAAFSQVAPDLLTSPGRGPAEGDELLRWMEENEREWRA